VTWNGDINLPYIQSGLNWIVANFSYGVLIASITVYIAYQQWRTAKDKLAFDLFEKRFSTYNHLKDWILQISQTGKVFKDDYTRLKIETQEIKWLFSESVWKYVNDELIAKAYKSMCIEIDIENHQLTGQKRTQRLNEQVSLAGWFTEQIDLSIPFGNGR
jgi:hypothetical protein